MLPGIKGLKGPLSCLTQARYGIVEPMPREDFTQQTVANLDAAHAEEVKRIKKRTK